MVLRPSLYWISSFVFVDARLAHDVLLQEVLNEMEYSRAVLKTASGTVSESSLRPKNSVEKWPT